MSDQSNKVQVWMRPGAVLGLQWFTVKRTGDAAKTIDAPLYPTMTPLQDSHADDYKLLLPVILEGSTWNTNPKLKEILAEKYGHTVGAPVKGSAIRLGVCTWLGGEVSWSRIAKGLFNPDTFHKLPRVRLCLGV